MPDLVAKKDTGFQKFLKGLGGIVGGFINELPPVKMEHTMADLQPEPKNTAIVTVGIIAVVVLLMGRKKFF